MEIVVVFIGMAIIIIVAAYVAQPLLVRTRKSAPQDLPPDPLLAERDSIYTAIRDLDFDFQTGKLLEADYRAMRDKYAVRGVEILKELDALGSTDRRPQATDRKQAVVVSDEIEAAVLARRKTKPQAASAEDDIEAAVRARRQSANRNPQSEIRTHHCPKCGLPIDAVDRFCAKCGAPLTVEATR